MADTIFALSSGRPPAGLAVIRVSGQRAFDAAREIAGNLPPERQASLRAFRDPGTGEILDRGLLLTASAPRTATGENIVEFQCHGGKATIDALLRALGSLPGLRMAEGGEFTRQALTNGILDLTAAEGLADLLSAETDMQRRVALRRADGAVRRDIEDIGSALLSLSASIELAIDYVDEDDGGSIAIPEASYDDLEGKLVQLLSRPAVERLRDGVRVVVAGPPNAGKSSLVNALAREERAIVTPVPGTTRDTIEVNLSLDGMPVVLVDTAGLRDAADPVEKIGIDRAGRAIEAADIVLWLGPASEMPNGALLVAAKADLAEKKPGLAFSAMSTLGHAELIEQIKDRARYLLPVGENIALTDRERALLEGALGEVRQAREASAVEISAEYLRRARNQLDRVTGRSGVEDMLKSLFSRFCVGK